MACRDRRSAACPYQKVGAKERISLLRPVADEAPSRGCTRRPRTRRSRALPGHEQAVWRLRSGGARRHGLRVWFLRVTSYAGPGKLFTASSNLMTRQVGLLTPEARTRIVDAVMSLMRAESPSLQNVISDLDLGTRPPSLAQRSGAARHLRARCGAGRRGLSGRRRFDGPSLEGRPRGARRVACEPRDRGPGHLRRSPAEAEQRSSQPAARHGRQLLRASPRDRPARRVSRRADRHPQEGSGGFKVPRLRPECSDWSRPANQRSVWHDVALFPN